MEIKQFKRFHQNELKRALRVEETELQELKQQLDNQIEMYNEIDSITLLSDPIQVMVIDNSSKEETIETITIANKRKHLKDIKNVIKILKEQIAHSEKVIESIRARRQMYNNPECIAINGDLIHGLIDIILFASSKDIQLSEIYKVIGMAIHLNGTYLINNGIPKEYNEGLRYNTSELLIRIAPYFDEFGQIVKTDDPLEFQSIMAELTADLIINISDDPVDFLKHTNNGFGLLKRFTQDLVEKMEQEKTTPKQEPTIKEQEQVVTTQELPKYQYVSRLKIKEYIRNDEVVQSCSLPEFQALLQECGLDESETKYYLGLMREYNEEILKCRQLSNRNAVMARFFTQEEQEIYEMAQESSDPTLKKVLEDLDTLSDLIADNNTAYIELEEEKKPHFDIIKLLINYVPTAPETPLIYLDETLNPIFLKSFEKLDKQEKKKATQLIEKIQNKSSVTMSKPVLGKNNRGVLYISSGKVKLCFTEYIPGEYIILSVGKEDTVFDDALKVVSSNHYQQFINNLNISGYRQSIGSICQNHLEEMKTKSMSKKDVAKLELKETTY